MRSAGLILISVLLVAAIGVLSALLPLAYTITLSVGVVIFILLLFRKIKPIWLIAAVMMIAPFYDILRATYLKNINFIGAWQEMVAVLLVFAFLFNIRQRRFHLPQLGIVDLLVIMYIFWNFTEVFQSPSIGAGLYVWRWYTIGPFFYFIFRFFPLDAAEEWTLYRAAIIGLAGAAAYTYYQYFIMGPEKAAQFVGSLGFTAFYRIGWRLPGPFSSPLVASACFSLLLIFGFTLLLKQGKFLWGLGLFGIGALAIFITLSRSGVAIALFAILTVALLSFSKLKKRLFVFILGAGLISLLMFQFPKIFPLSQEFVNFVFSTDVNQFDTNRFDSFKNIVLEAFTKYPLGFGFGGGGAISQTAYALFGGDPSRLMITDKLGGDSVFFATLQTSGFLGFLLITGICGGFILFGLRTFKYIKNSDEKIKQLFLVGFFVGVTFTFANLTDVWPLKMYVWTFGAMILNRYFGNRPFQNSKLGQEPKKSSQGGLPVQPSGRDHD
jgi:hypothetical protein